MKQLSILFSLSLIATTAWAQKTDQATETLQPAAAAEISVDESNFKEIFNRSVSEQTQTVQSKSKSIDVELSGQYMTYSDLELQNNYFGIDHSAAFKNVPGFQLGSSFQAAKLGGLQMAPYMAAGYGFREEKLTVITKTGVGIKDVVALHMMPLSAGIQLKHRIPGTKRFSVFATPTLGTQWIYREGTLDGINQSYWIPFYGARAGFVMFENASTSTKSGGWFDGVSIGTSYKKSFSSGAQLQAWSADLGIKLLL